VNVRKFLPAFRDLDRLVAAGSISRDGAELLTAAMRDGRSVLVSGSTHAGKTTLLAALIAASPVGHRIVTVEETFELAVDAPDIVSLQGRQPSLEGSNRHCCIGCHSRRSQWRRGSDAILHDRTIAHGRTSTTCPRRGGGWLAGGGQAPEREASENTRSADE